MSSVTINSKMTSSDALGVLESAVAGLESATAALAGSINRDRGAPFSAVRAVWEAQKRLSEACSTAPVRGGDDLWPRVAAAKRAAEANLVKSRHFHEMWKRREEARRVRKPERANGMSNGVRPTDTPAPTAPGRWEFGGEDFRVTPVDGGVVHTGVDMFVHAA